jgi:hypothetical protein
VAEENDEEAADVRRCWVVRGVATLEKWKVSVSLYSRLA